MHKIVFHIDDDDDDLMFFSEALNAMPHLQVSQFRSFHEAVTAIAHGGRPDVIVMDFWVPGMAATHFLQQVSQHLDLTEVPIMVLSGTEVPLFFRELLDKYRVRYLTKPHDPAVFASMLFSNFSDGEASRHEMA
ncbi:response regulator [Flavobacterium sp. MAH-1]|uniref:Response regulator n=1 Tax=Flavobacterium agri TaxID=2743471 RepID=A0A7Y8Y3R4_9FLAO|nr:response regulator [Flavobacterium agri]NUY81957.1 response regulator [Flavobacterium agri]NYA71981.1 response regulator [Flavobacterium agri]